MEIGEAWFLQQLALQRSDADLRALVADTAKRLTNHPQARLLRPDAAALPLPEDPGHGVMRLATYVSAPTGQPTARALEFIDAFTATPATGYVLTHQFLVLEWARHVGLAMPEQVWERRGGLLERIAAEQAVDHQFSDLFAERAAILLAFSAPDSREADRWIELIAAAQTGDGRWTSPRSLITYDGQQAPTNHPWVHTTGFVAAASGFYLQRRGRRTAAAKARERRIDSMGMKSAIRVLWLLATMGLPAAATTNEPTALGAAKLGASTAEVRKAYPKMATTNDNLGAQPFQSEYLTRYVVTDVPIPETGEKNTGSCASGRTSSGRSSCTIRRRTEQSSSRH